MLTKLLNQLSRLDPGDRDNLELEITRATTIGDSAAIWWGPGPVGEWTEDKLRSISFCGEPVEILLAEVDAAAAVLELLPDGAPIEEGIDGSLWEVLYELGSGGPGKAREYVLQHYHGPGMRVQGEWNPGDFQECLPADD